jgi:hypothetical protein
MTSRSGGVKVACAGLLLTAVSAVAGLLAASSNADAQQAYQAGSGTGRSGQGARQGGGQNIPADYVQVPIGWQHPSCLHHVPNGARIDEHQNVYLNEQLIEHHEPCGYQAVVLPQLASPPSGGGDPGLIRTAACVRRLRTAEPILALVRVAGSKAHISTPAILAMGGTTSMV